MNHQKVSLEARHISLSYSTTEVLRDVNTRIEPGEFFALLWPHMTVEQNVAFGLVERKESKAEIKRKVGAALDLIGLGEYALQRLSAVPDRCPS